MGHLSRGRVYLIEIANIIEFFGIESEGPAAYRSIYYR
jgi:hypothetical protein